LTVVTVIVTVAVFAEHGPVHTRNVKLSGPW